MVIVAFIGDDPLRPWSVGVEPGVAAALLQDGQRQQRLRRRVQLQQQGEGGRKQEGRGGGGEGRRLQKHHWCRSVRHG